jgi:hypothetical protein
VCVCVHVCGVCYNPFFAGVVCWSVLVTRELCNSISVGVPQVAGTQNNAIAVSQPMNIFISKL